MMSLCMCRHMVHSRMIGDKCPSNIAHLMSSQVIMVRSSQNAYVGDMNKNLSTERLWDDRGMG